LTGPATVVKAEPTDEILRLDDLKVHFPVKMPFVQRLLQRGETVVHAVDGVSFGIRPGEILGLVGESGCGKSTVGRACVRLVKPTAGRIFFDGQDITKLGGEKLRALRRRIQIIFQDPHASLNPAMTIGKAIGHPLRIHSSVFGPQKTGSEEFGEWIRQKVLNAMKEVGLTPEEQLYDKYPGDLSGGQKQRAVMARALILEPNLLVVDEGVSMLDMSVRAKVLELMLDLKRRHKLTYLFITHDLATAKFICDKIAIMYLGRIVEIGPAREIYADRSIRIPRLCSRLFLYRIRIGEQRRCYLGARCPMLFIHLRDAGFIRDALLFLRLVAGRRGTLSTFWMSTYQTRRGRGMTRLFWDLSRTGGQRV